jgi:hypothetical protein
VTGGATGGRAWKWISAFPGAALMPLMILGSLLSAAGAFSLVMNESVWAAPCVAIAWAAAANAIGEALGRDGDQDAVGVGFAGAWAFFLCVAPAFRYDLAGAGAALATAFGIHVAGWWGAQRGYRRYAVIAEPNLCGTCGYDLTGLESETCPECGKQAALRGD